MKKIGLLMLTLVIVVMAVASCGDALPEVNDAVTGSVETTTTVPAISSVCIAGGDSKYSFVRAEECSGIVQEIVTDCWHTYQGKFGSKIQILTDWLKRGEEPPAMADEILIGLTNRPESISLTEGLEEGTYRIKVVDRRIVICATAEWMLEEACEVFFSYVTQEEDGTWVIPSDLDVIGSLAGFSRPGWKLDAVPAYDGGELALAAFNEPLHFKEAATKSRMMVVGRTTRGEFEAYLEKSKGASFEIEPVIDRDGMYAVRMHHGDVHVYAYYTEGTKTAKIISESGDSVPLEQFNYTYEKKPGDTTTMYQFGLVMDKNGVDFNYNNKTRLNCGHMYFMKLADNSIVVIDGGGIQQMSNQTSKELLRLFREVTGTGEGEKVRISGWFISHRHPDHYNGFARFLNQNHQHVDVERIFYNIASADGDIDRIRNLLSTHYKNIMYHKPHTGETIQLADVSFDVLHTLEDQVSSATGMIESTDFNDTTTVLRIQYDGIRLLQLGDAANSVQRVMMRAYEKDALQCDVLQVAHHGWNDLSSLYNAMTPVIALYPQSSGGAQKGLNGNAYAVYARIKKIAKEMCFAGDETVGVSVVNGVPTVTYRAPVVGEDYTGWGY